MSSVNFAVFWETELTLWIIHKWLYEGIYAMIDISDNTVYEMAKLTTSHAKWH